MGSILVPIYTSHSDFLFQLFENLFSKKNILIEEVGETSNTSNTSKSLGMEMGVSRLILALKFKKYFGVL